MATIDSAEAGAWHKRLAKRLQIRGFVLLGIALLILLIGVGIGIAAGIEQNARAVEVVTSAAIVAATFSPLVLIFVIWGLVDLRRFRNRSVH